MPGPTEAELLFHGGRLYIRRAGWTTPRGLLFAGIKHGGWSMYDADDPHLHFDLEGRWQRLLRDGVHYRKSWDGQVVAMSRERQDGVLVLERTAVPEGAPRLLDDWVQARLGEIADALQSGRLGFRPPPAPARPLEGAELGELLARSLRWDEEARQRDREAWVAVYPEPLVLPPAAGLALVVLPSALAPERFEAHVERVKALHGRRLAQARFVMLGGRDVLEAPTGVVLAWLDTIRRLLPLGDWPAGQRPGEREPAEVALGGIEAVIQPSTRSSRVPADWSRLRAGGLRRITVAVEHPGDPLEPLLAPMREGGIAVSVWTPPG